MAKSPHVVKYLVLPIQSEPSIWPFVVIQNSDTTDLMKEVKARMMELYKRHKVTQFEVYRLGDSDDFKIETEVRLVSNG